METDQSTVAIGYLAFQVAVIVLQIGLSVFIAKKVGLRKRWGLLGFPFMVITAQIFKLISPLLRFLEPLVTSIVQPMGGSGVVGLFVVVTLIVMMISLVLVYFVMKLLKNKGFN